MSSHSEPDSSSISATINPTNQVNKSLQAESDREQPVPQVSSNLATYAPCRRASGLSRRRNQKRQLQRENINRKRVSEEASRIQKEFNLYPGKAVRKALCETSDAFSGDVELRSGFKLLTTDQYRTTRKHRELRNSSITVRGKNWMKTIPIH